ncbi:MAG: NADH-quinone oxidoreductase subunit L [bacterium]|nr:NADH-quinone oxidoreductase subunit L [bacterium]
MFSSLSFLIPIIPLLGFAVVGLFVAPEKTKLAHRLTLSAVLTSFVIALGATREYFLSEQALRATGKVPLELTWIPFSSGLTDTGVAELTAKFGILLDPISCVLTLLVCTVSFLAQLYSTGYMEGHPGYRRFFACMSLFTGAMLGLVLSSNILQTFVFWELVGLGSFTLISFYFDKPSAVAAGKKAFIVTRFADLGFLLGVLILTFEAGTFSYSELAANLAEAPSATVALGCALVAIGAFGKSAMFPLHIWLPDAMEGPTPVSALIHAATMVVAGVYLIARLIGVYLLVPDVLYAIAVVGAFTSLFAAIIACTQYDIKRVLAFSTLSQIAYMMLALGSTSADHTLGYTAAMFHMTTHAFFKALLFLCAGAVIHAVHTNDIRQMGGLARKMPVTHLTFLIGCLAITAMPPYLVSGFFSKDEILLSLQQSGHSWLLTIASFVAMLTAFYMFRLYFLVFWNHKADADCHAHDPVASMKIPLLALAIPSIAAGWFPFADYVFVPESLPHHAHAPLGLIVMATLLSLTGAGIAWAFYAKTSTIPGRIISSTGFLGRAAQNKFYIDEVYLFVTKKIIFQLVSFCFEWFDSRVVDKTMDRIADGTHDGAMRSVKMGTGFVQHQIVGLATGFVLLAAVIIASL